MKTFRLKLYLLFIAALMCGAYVIKKAFYGLGRTELQLPLSHSTQPTHKTIMTMSREDVLTLQNTIKDSIKKASVKYDGSRSSDVTIETTLTLQEKQGLDKCVKDDPLYRRWENRGVEQLRWEQHEYLKKEGAVLIEIGGNRGNDAAQFVQRFNPRWYVILEPLEVYYHRLEKMFTNNPRVTLFNLGLGQKEEVANVVIAGNEGDATSQFSNKNVGPKKGDAVPIYITNAVEFLTKIGVGIFEVDLIHINCEGCEYEMLENMLSSGFVKHFKNIQIQTHPRLSMLKDPYQRYCRIEQLLSRTHHLTYQYKYVWENWRRNDL